MHNGFPVCRYPVTPNTMCSQPGCYGIHEGIDANGNHWEEGHAMVLVGYDRNQKLLLFKNSWGNTLRYHWISYKAIEEKALGANVVLAVRDPNLPPPPEGMWIGRWTMDHDGWPGELVIRRPGKLPPVTINDDFTLISVKVPGNDRIGTYTGQGGDSHEVTGNVGGGTSLIWVDFDHLEGPPDLFSDPVNLNGQMFFLRMFVPEHETYLFGNFASGETEWSGLDFGVLLHRPDIDVKHIPGTFNLNLWKDRFKLYLADGATKTLEVTEIGPLDQGGYPVTFTYDKSKKSGYILDVEPHRLISSALPSDLFYHTHETGIVSGLGAFGIRSLRCRCDRDLGK